MLWSTGVYMKDVYLRPELSDKSIPYWLRDEVKKHLKKRRNEDVAYRPNVRVLSSQIGSARTWWTILEHLPHLLTSHGERFEYRYPYLDRDLVEFLFSIPREQLARPGRRRSLMRRALRGVVPELVLERNVRRGLSVSARESGKS